MKYTKPMAELEEFKVVDVVTTSTTPAPGGDGTIETEDEEL